MWQVIAASVVGTSHTQGGIPCQDAHAYIPHAQFVVAAVADGLGSAEMAQIGSSEAVRVATQSIDQTLVGRGAQQTLLDFQPTMTSVFQEVRSHLNDIAEQDERPLHDYATTLICAVITTDWIATAHVGDGAVIAVVDDTEEVISEPEFGQYVNEVTSITSEDYEDHVRINIKEGTISGAALLSDGLQHLALDMKDMSPFQPFLNPLFEGITQPLTEEPNLSLAAFLASERICSRTNDDKTLLVVGRLSDPATS